MAQLNPKQRGVLERILLEAGDDYRGVLDNMRAGASAYSEHPALQAFYEVLLMQQPLDPLTVFVQARRPWPSWAADPASNLRRLSPRDVMGMTAWMLVCPANADRSFADATLDSLAAAIAYEALDSPDPLPSTPVASPADFRTAWDLVHHYLSRPDYASLAWTRQAMLGALPGLPALVPQPPKPRGMDTVDVLSGVLRAGLRIVGGFGRN